MVNVNKRDKNIEIPQMDFVDLESIVNIGVKPKVSFMSYLIECYKELGFKNIFHDKNELIVIGLIGILMMIFSIASIAETTTKYIYIFTFIISPILYLSVVWFSFYNSREKGAFDIEMTCKYDLYQLSALRMFSFSIVSILINSFSIIIVGALLKHVDIIRMIIISITGLFLFSTVFLYSLMRFRWKHAKFIVIAIWIVGNVFISSINYPLYLQFLMKMPLYIHLGISVVCGIMYIKNLNKLINYRRKKGEI